MLTSVSTSEVPITVAVGTRSALGPLPLGGGKDRSGTGGTGLDGKTLRLEDFLLDEGRHGATTPGQVGRLTRIAPFRGLERGEIAA